jgi:hypothetical protein
LQIQELNTRIDKSLKEVELIYIPPPTNSLQDQDKETYVFGCNRCGKQVALTVAQSGHACDPKHVAIMESLFGPYEATLMNNNNNNNNSSNSSLQHDDDDDDDTMVVYAQKLVTPAAAAPKKEEKKKMDSILKKKGKRKEPEPETETKEEPPKKKVRFSRVTEEKKIEAKSLRDQPQLQQPRPQPDQVDINLAMLEILTYLPWVAEGHELPSWLNSSEFKAGMESIPDDRIYSMALVEMKIGAFGMPIFADNKHKHRATAYRNHIMVTKSGMPSLLAWCIKQNIRLVRERTDQKALIAIAPLAAEFNSGVKSYSRLLQLADFINLSMIAAGISSAYVLNSLVSNKITGRRPLGRKMTAMEDRYFRVKQANEAADDAV